MQKIYVNTFQALLPITIGQFLEELHNFVEICEPKDLKISTHRAINTEVAKAMVFGNSYKTCVPVYVTVDSSHLEIRCSWFSEFIGDELGKLYDFCIPAFSANYSERTEISARGLQEVLLEEKTISLEEW